MNKTLRQRGYTLIELLVAVTLIAMVLAMVYGSYIATTDSAQACTSRIALSEEGRETVEQIARHIRCSYASHSDNQQDDRPRPGHTQVVPEREVSYFVGNGRAAKGEILNFVTTSGMFQDEGSKDGLFRVVYRFDRRAGELAVSLTDFVGTAEKAEKRDWRVIADRIKSVELEFFDGEKWLKRWDYQDRKGLPRAARIRICGENKSLQRYDYSTVAYVSCRAYTHSTQTETSASTKKQ